MTGPGDDPLDFARKPAKSYRGIKFGRDVVGKLRGSIVFIVTLVHRRRVPAPEELRR